MKQTFLSAAFRESCMSLEERFDAIVIVDGFSGYATAYTLTKMGLETLSIEQTLSFANKGG